MFSIFFHSQLSRTEGYFYLTSSSLLEQPNYSFLELYSWTSEGVGEQDYRLAFPWTFLLFFCFLVHIWWYSGLTSAASDRDRKCADVVQSFALSYGECMCWASLHKESLAVMTLQGRELFLIFSLVSHCDYISGGTLLILQCQEYLATYINTCCFGGHLCTGHWENLFIYLFHLSFWWEGVVWAMPGGAEDLLLMRCGISNLGQLRTRPAHSPQYSLPDLVFPSFLNSPLWW